MNMLTYEQALNAQEFHSNRYRNYDGSCQRWRRNGRTHTWKTRPNAFRIPVKHGLYGYGQIYENDARNFHTAEDCPFLHSQKVNMGNEA